MPWQSDKILELYPQQYRALDTCADLNRCSRTPRKLCIAFKNTCNFAYVAKFEFFLDQDELILRSQIFF